MGRIANYKKLSNKLTEAGIKNTIEGKIVITESTNLITKFEYDCHGDFEMREYVKVSNEFHDYTLISLEQAVRFMKLRHGVIDESEF